MTIRLHGVSEWRFVAPADVQEDDKVMTDPAVVEPMVGYLEELAAYDGPETSEATKARHRACTRTAERTVLVKRPVK